MECEWRAADPNEAWTWFSSLDAPWWIAGDTGLPFLAPEIQLLYKSKQMRARDQVDFNRTAPRLTAAARAWLLESLEYVDPEHRWISTLKQKLA